MKATEYRKLKKQIEVRYKQAIELAEKERLEQSAALEVIWKMCHVPRRSRVKQTVSLQPIESSALSTAESSSIEYGSLIDTLKKSISLVSPEKFICKNVKEAMEKISGRKFNYSSVANCLKRLAKEKNAMIEIIKQGHGKSPSVYRLKNIHSINETKVTEERKT